MTLPRYSIIIPTRNRQRYALSAVESVIAAAAGRDDVEIVVADASDDADVLAIGLAEASLLKRVTLAPPAGRRLSMRENWERAVAAATGAYLSVIGDDDALLPWTFDVWDAFTDAIKTPMFASAWVDYRWECYPGRSAGRLIAPLGAANITACRSAAMLAQHAQWRTKDKWPPLGPSLYHGLVRRDLIDRTRELYGSVFLSFVVDYSVSITNLALTKGFVYFSAPLTVMGACGASNSAGLTGRTAQERLDDLREENPNLPAVPAGLEESRLSAPRVALGYEQIFSALGVQFTLPPAKLLQSCATELTNIDDADDFERERAILVDYAMANNLDMLSVAALVHRPAERLTGRDPANDRLWVDASALRWRTAAEAARGVGALIQNPAEDLARLRRMAEEAGAAMEVWSQLGQERSAAESPATSEHVSEAELAPQAASA